MSYRSFPSNINRWSASVGMAGRVDAEPVEGIDSPRYGRWWWFWLPRLRWNHGCPWRNEVCDLTFQWLCFWIDFTLFTSKR